MSRASLYGRRPTGNPVPQKEAHPTRESRSRGGLAPTGPSFVARGVSPWNLALQANGAPTGRHGACGSPAMGSSYSPPRDRMSFVTDSACELCRPFRAQSTTREMYQGLTPLAKHLRPAGAVDSAFGQLRRAVAPFRNPKSAIRNSLRSFPNPQSEIPSRWNGTQLVSER